MRSNLSDRAVNIIIMSSNEELSRISVKKIASALGVNASYLSRKFNKDKNLSITEFYTGERLRRCAFLLLKTKKRPSVRTLNRLAGYSRSDYFVQLFKELYGVHPAKFPH